MWPRAPDERGWRATTMAKRVPAHDRGEAALTSRLTETATARRAPPNSCTAVEHGGSGTARARVVEQLAQQEGGALAASVSTRTSKASSHSRVSTGRVGDSRARRRGDNVGEVGHPIMVNAGSRRGHPASKLDTSESGKPMSGQKKRCYDVAAGCASSSELPTLIAASTSSVCSGSELHFLILRARYRRARICRGHSYRKQ